MKVYISASSFYKAHGLADILKKRFKSKITVVSSWHCPDKDSNPEQRLTEDEKPQRAVDNMADLEKAGILILMEDFDSVPGGKHFELGAAWAKGIRTITLGRREHGYTRLPDITNAANLQELIGILKNLV